MSDELNGRAPVPGWVWGVGALFLALVGANLAMTVFADRLPSVLSAERVQAIAFWGGWGVAAAACVGGAVWTAQALAVDDRDSTRRLRACFLVALSAVLLLAVAAFEEVLGRPQLAAVAAGLMALAIVPFAVSARALAGGGRRRRRRRSSEDAR